MAQPAFDSLSDAVRYALEHTDIGTKSSLDALSDAAWPFYNGFGYTHDNGKSANAVACAVRSAYRKKKGLKEDARTYKTQSRRDMRNDKKMQRDKWMLAQTIMDDLNIDALSSLVNTAHSIDQLKLMIKTYKQTKEFVNV